MKNIERILVIRTDRIGEVLLTTPVLTALKEKYPQAKISVMVRRAAREIIEGNPNADEIIEYTGKKKGVREAFRLGKIFRSGKFDIAIIANPKKEFHLAAFLAGIPARVGFDRKWGFLLTHRVRDLKFLAEKHEIEYNLDLVRALGVEPKDKRPVLAAKEALDEVRHLRETGLGGIARARLIAIHPCTSNPKKQWPIEHFAKLSDLLIENGYNVAVVSGLEEIKTAREVICRMKCIPIDLTGKLTLKELAALFKRCAFLISGDSGPVHIAAAVGTVVVDLFGAADPGSKPTRWGPYGNGHIVIKKDSLEDIKAEEVFGKIKNAYIDH